MSRQTVSHTQSPQQTPAMTRIGVLQRKCACANHTVAGGECGACAKKKTTLQRKPAVGSSNEPLQHGAEQAAEQLAAEPTREVPSIVSEVLHSPGAPLDAATRAFMETSFRHDFTHVRVHTDARAVDSARAVSALAYTVGHNVVFGQNQYTPTTWGGRRLLAHELAHTIQQRDLNDTTPSAVLHGAVESSADGAAQNVARGEAVSTHLPASGPGLSRSPDPDTERARAVAEAEAVAARLEEQLRAADDDDVPAPKPAPNRRTDLSLVRPDPRQITDEEIYRDLDSYRQQERANTETKRKQEALEDAGRHDRVMMLRRRIEQHGYSKFQLDALLKSLPMRDLLVLRRHGLQWRKWYTKRVTWLNSIKRAMDSYDFEWRKVNSTGAAPVAREFTEKDFDALQEQARIQRIREAQREGYASTTGSFVGAVAGGVTREFTDDEETIAGMAGLGATTEGALGSLMSAKGKQGSYSPEAEKPFDPVGSWRYGPAPTTSATIPAKPTTHIGTEPRDASGQAVDKKIPWFNPRKFKEACVGSVAACEKSRIEKARWTEEDIARKFGETDTLLTGKNIDLRGARDYIQTAIAKGLSKEAYDLGANRLTQGHYVIFGGQSTKTLSHVVRATVKKDGRLVIYDPLIAGRKITWLQFVGKYGRGSRAYRIED